jgi:hypothetical protein
MPSVSQRINTNNRSHLQFNTHVIQSIACFREQVDLWLQAAESDALTGINCCSTRTPRTPFWTHAPNDCLSNKTGCNSVSRYHADLPFGPLTSRLAPLLPMTTPCSYTSRPFICNCVEWIISYTCVKQGTSNLDVYDVVYMTCTLIKIWALESRHQVQSRQLGNHHLLALGGNSRVEGRVSEVASLARPALRAVCRSTKSIPPPFRTAFFLPLSTVETLTICPQIYRVSLIITRRYDKRDLTRNREFRCKPLRVCMSI